ncbi:MAG: Eco57I restriction-modification methylase domain-containing protein [Verrucomicrobia bacterium]|nr:Eco57I restriction-modification methylase domain-containing protein [Verrucomicrobiota bacterium]
MARLTYGKQRASARQQKRVVKESSAAVAYKRAARANAKHRFSKQRELGQYPTPLPVAELMASMFANREKEVRLLDAGAGTGSLIQAFVEVRCAVKPLPVKIHVVAYEVDSSLLGPLQRTLEHCRKHCLSLGVHFTADVHNADFIESALPLVRGDLFNGPQTPFNATILNPPYRKISSDSQTRLLLRSAGIETSNLYTGFLALAAKLLCEGGEMVAITPRSFANGPYFRPFRELFLRLMSLRRFHVFESRSVAFEREDVLQENIILHAAKSPTKPRCVVVSTSSGAPDAPVTARECAYSEVVLPGDPEQFIHLVTDDVQQEARQILARFHTSLAELGLEVSTGRVVDFRARQFLVSQPASGTVPLIYPCHFNGGYVKWPKTPSRKPNAILDTEATEELLVPSAVYVLAKRFTAKEERRRVVACIYNPARIQAARVGFENHLNYFHARGAGLQLDLARGLAAFLNSTVLDVYFRQFNGHTQVNATDLRNLRYPSRSQLESLGRHLGETFPDQQQLDQLVHKELF